MDPAKKEFDPIADSTMSLGDHLEELRLRLILALTGLVVGLILCLVFGRFIITFIEGPYIGVMGKDARLQALAPTDGFVCYMQISLISGVILTSPWIFYQLWMFVASGLYPHEKKYVYLAVPLTAGLFIIGAMFFILVIAPVGLAFLIKFNTEFLGVASNFTFKAYVSFVAVMMLVFGLGFQMPIVIFFLLKTGIVPIESLQKSRKFVVLAVVIVAAIATPGPDPFSQIALAIPLYGLFELGMLLWRFSERKKRLVESE